MPLDPHTAGLLEMIASSGYPPIHEGDPDTARRAMRAMTCDLVTPEAQVPVGSVEERKVPGAEGELDARLYKPEGAGPWPTLAYLHGGGFVIGDLDTHDQTCRRLCRDAEVAVLSVDYRLAPEAPFPAAPEDALAACRWAADHLDELGGTDRLAVGGDSAGGNLAAVVSQAMPDKIAAQLLIYPAVDAMGDYPSRQENAEGYFLELATMEWFFTHYVGHTQVGEDDLRHSPLRAPDLSNQPPAVVVTAEFDPLRDEGEAYADKLSAAGVDVRRERFGGLVHGFIDMTFSPVADKAVGRTVELFKELVHR